MIQKALHYMDEQTNERKMTMDQLVMIENSRQIVLSPNMKSKLIESQKVEESARRRLLTVWENVIQGNILELDSSIQQSVKATGNSQLDLMRLRTLYEETFII
jgi:hypothetical protein